MATNEIKSNHNNIITSNATIKTPKHRNNKSKGNILDLKGNQLKFAFYHSAASTLIQHNISTTPTTTITSSSSQTNHLPFQYPDSLGFKESLSTEDFTFPKTSPLSQMIQKGSVDLDTDPEPERERSHDQDHDHDRDHDNDHYHDHDQDQYHEQQQQQHQQEEDHKQDNAQENKVSSIILQRKVKNIKKANLKIHAYLMKVKNDPRSKYYTKLIITDYWLPFRERPQYNSIIIFDWDDTLFPTTYLKNRVELHQDHRTNEVLNRKIKKLELSVRTLLSSAINKGNTYIITNAELDWIKFTSSKFYPLLMPLMDKITIISARDENQMNYPGNDRMWKIMSFMNIVKNYNCNKVTNIVCIGDSPIEMEAGKRLSSRFSQVCMKGIKFKAFPRIQEVLMQVKAVIRQFDYIYSAVKTWTIRVEKKS